MSGIWSTPHGGSASRSSRSVCVDGSAGPKAAISTSFAHRSTRPSFRERAVSETSPGVGEPLRYQGVPFRNDVVVGPGGSQILIQDPSGNLVELFQPAG